MPATFCQKCGNRLQRIEDLNDSSPKLRLTCPAADCGFVFYDNPVPVVAAVVQRGDSIVLLRNKSWPQSWFGLCTGFLEKAEDPFEGVQREVEEELGLVTESCSLIGVYPFARLNQIIVAYHVVVNQDHPIVIDPVEIAEYRLVPIPKLRPWPGGTGDAVRDWLQQQRRSAERPLIRAVL